MKVNLTPATVLCAILLVSACGGESDEPTGGDFIVDNPYDGLWQESPDSSDALSLLNYWPVSEYETKGMDASHFEGSN